jgi:hypothetical protein
MLLESDLKAYNAILFELYDFAKGNEPFVVGSGNAELILLELLRDDLAITITRDPSPGSIPPQTYFAISKMGRALINSLPDNHVQNPYGWHLEKRRQQEALEATRKEISDVKLKYDLKTAKRIYNSYWWTFSFALIGLLISIILLILKIVGK